MKRAVIQAGGKGTRLYPYTAVLPKPLMPIDEIPILEIVVRQLVHYGFRDLTITVGHLGHLIMAVLGDGARFGARIEYLRENKPRGTIGALSGLRDVNEPILVMNGDLLTDFNFRHFMEDHLSRRNELSVGTYFKKFPVSLGVLELDENNNTIGFCEKPVLTFPCSMGIYAINPRLMQLIPRAGMFGFDDLMAMCLERRIGVHAHRFDGLWLDIGRPEDYASAGELFNEYRDRFLPPRRLEMLTPLPSTLGEPMRPQLIETVAI